LSLGSTRALITSAARPTGTLIRKAGRQVVLNRLALTSSPPTTCPTAAPPASTAVYRLVARSRDCPSKLRWMIERTCGTIAAAPTPCTARKAISPPVFGASPQASEERVNRASPARNIRPWPHRSPSRAPVTMSTA
jgi:hypothetical protein